MARGERRTRTRAGTARPRGARDSSSSATGTRSAIVRTSSPVAPRACVTSPYSRSASTSTHAGPRSANACARCVATKVQPAPPLAPWTAMTVARRSRSGPVPTVAATPSSSPSRSPGQTKNPRAPPRIAARREATDSRVATAIRGERAAPSRASRGSATTASGSSWRTASASCRSSAAVATTRARPDRSRKWRISSATSGASSASTTLATSSMHPPAVRGEFSRGAPAPAGGPPYDERPPGRPSPSRGGSGSTRVRATATCTSKREGLGSMDAGRRTLER